MHSRLSFSRTSLAVGLAAAACFATGQAAQGASFQTIYNFKGAPDGEGPLAGLIYANGTFYGTTEIGGATFRNGKYGREGTVFSIVGGTEKVIYSFGRAHDGALPYGGVIDVGGILYGTTAAGGDNNSGTVFQLSPTGEEQVLHHFNNLGANGESPLSSLLYRHGRFFGTVANGTSFGDGAVLSMAPSGKERVLLPFDGYVYGAHPMAGLTDIGGRLYGTTSAGGEGTGCTGGCGSVFELLPHGGYRVVYNFQGGSDGAAPLSAVVGIDGTIYGTTSAGGMGQCTCGTVFKITPDGTKTTLYSFAGGRDGNMAGSLTAVGNVLYGTTSGGGGGYSVCEIGCGTVFKITEQGVETVLHRFQGPDGNGPASGAKLLYVSGALYGTTQAGGSSNRGTVFSVTP
jgi:uncharacterized repeat protein (TIGR03803 family)